MVVIKYVIQMIEINKHSKFKLLVKNDRLTEQQKYSIIKLDLIVKTYIRGGRRQ